MNRRDFLKGGLFGAFGAVLTWAGVVRAEGEQQDEREFCDAGCANCPYWDSCDNAPQDYGPQVNTEETEGPKFGEVDCNSYSGCSDCPAQPRCETEPGPASDNVSWEDVPPERDPCDICACRAECDADSVYWCSVEGIETRANNPWASGAVRAEERPTDSDTADGEIVECNLLPLLVPQNLDDAILRRPIEPWVSCDDCPRESYCEIDGCALKPLQPRGGDPYFCKCGWGIKVDEQGRIFKSYDMGMSWDDTGVADTYGYADLSDILEGLPPLRPAWPMTTTGGAVWHDAGNGRGHWIHWSDYGSDENGDGTPWHHVATEACAQSIADLG